MATNTGTAIGYSARNITGQATTVVNTGSGILHSLVFGGPTATGVVTIYDNTSAAGTPLAIITTPANPLPSTLLLDIAYSVGLTVVTGTANQNVTVTYV